MTLPRWVLPAAGGAATFLLTRLAPGSPLREQAFDSPPLQVTGEQIAAGGWPYREVFVEYPPLGMPMVALPALAPGLSYGTAFKLLQTLCALLAIAGATALLAQTQVSARRLYAAAVAVGLGPLLLGELALNRFDLWPAGLSVAALALVAAGRPRSGAAVLGAASLAKLYPLLLVPLVAVHVWRRFGARTFLVSAASFAAVLAVVLVPLLAVAQDGLSNSLLFHKNRPLHLESLGGGVLAVLEAAGRYEATFEFSFGSANLVGALPDGVATLSAVLQVVAVAAVVGLYVRGPASNERLVAAGAATVALAVVLGKVLSPQFAAWLIPLAPLVAGPLGLAAATVLAAALVATQVLYPRLDDAWEFDGGALALLTLRNALLVVTAALLVAAAARRAPR